MTDAELDEQISQLPGWNVDGKSLKRRVEFANFAEALDFVNRVGVIAEDADHHPDIFFGWGYAEISLTTHDRGGITDLDFEIAAKINGL